MILDQLLQSRNLKSKDELTATERLSYDKWEKTLYGKLEVEDIEKAILFEKQRLQEEWLNEDTKNPFNYLFHWKKETDIKARLKNLDLILKLISNNEKRKEDLVKYIKSLINNKSK